MENVFVGMKLSRGAHILLMQKRVFQMTGEQT